MYCIGNVDREPYTMTKTPFTSIALFTFLASLLLISGCTETIDIQLEPNVDAYVVTDSKNKISLSKTDPAHAELQNWLNENNTGWHNTMGRFPGGVYIKSGKDGIQVTGMEIVIYSTTGPQPDAKYVRNVGKKELPLVRGIGQ